MNNTDNLHYYGKNYNKQRKKNKPKEKNNIAEKKAILLAVIVVGIAMICAVVLSAKAAEIKHRNNEIIAQNEELRDNIDMMNIKIRVSSNIATVEKAAREKLGMVHPNSSQYIYIGEEDRPDANFAALIKEQAYN